MLTWSIPVAQSHNQSNLRFIDNVRVVISNGQQTDATLTYNASRKIYSVPSGMLRIASSEEYHLKVDVPVEQLIKASCYILLPNKSLNFYNIDTIRQNGSHRIVVEYDFTDSTPDQPNYYAPSAYREVLVCDWQNDVDVCQKIPLVPDSYDKHFSNTTWEGQDYLLRDESWHYS